MEKLYLAAFGAALILVAIVLLLRGGRALAALRQDHVKTQAELAASVAALAREREALAQAAKLEMALRARAETLAAEKAERERLHAHEAALVAERTRAWQDAKAAHQQAQAEAEAHRKAAEADRTALATQTETLDQERRQAVAKLQLLEDARAAMTREFKLLADEIMQRHGTSFAKTNLEQLDVTLTPLRQKILEFQQSLQSAHIDSGKERALLAEQIKTLNETSARMSGETQNLTQALKGKSQTQGAWGEMILQTILEKSGLREGEEFSVQQSFVGEDAQRLRPDVVVNLPNSQHIVIDAKVSLTAFAASISAAGEDERAAHLRSHALSLRKHVVTLAAKEYRNLAGGALDYVIMFVPIEGALAAALTSEPELTGFAVEHSVYIATPTTLMIALRTVANVWNVERRNRNAEDIAQRAGRVYDKMCGFLGSMEALGKALGAAQDQHGRAMDQLSRGRGNALRQLEQLKALGAKAGKSLPPHLLGEDEAEALPPPQADPPLEQAAD